MADAAVGIEAEASVLATEEELNANLEAAFAGWRPAKGDPLDWLIRGWARITATLKEQASDSSELRLRKFGEAVLSVPPVLAAPAYVESTWTLVDDAGYTIPAGTQVAVAAAGDVATGFLTVGDVTVAPEATMATVLLQATELGVGGNGVTGDVSLIDALAFVDSIVLLSPSSGGVDEENEAAYLARLVGTVRLLSLALILPPDFETDARAVPGIERAKCVRNYNPTDKTSDNPLMQTVFPIDKDGEPIGTPGKGALLARQEAKLLTDVIHHVEDPDYTKVDVKSTFVVATGFDPATVIAAVEARLVEYLSPGNWGLPNFGDSSNSGGWVNRATVYRFELISEIDRVGGVDRVESVELAKHGSALGTANVTLAGVAPLTRPGDIEVLAA